MPSTRRIGILGGTFDPIHCGHLDAGSAAVTALGLTELFVVPAHIPPHRPQPVASGYHRFAMVALAVSGRRGWRATDIELRHEAPSYTSVTFGRFHERGYAPSELFFVIGADAFAEIGTWKDYPKILACANFAVVSRPGHPVSDLPNRLEDLSSRMITHSLTTAVQQDDTPWIFLITAHTANVSSSAIRERQREGRPIAGLVVPAVQQHIEQHQLYSPAAPDQNGGDEASSRVAGRLYGQG
jgi:nicotinate-nucleotide adenylyltransferase